MRRFNIVVPVLTLLLAFTACDDGGTTPTLGNTPAQVLEAVERAFQDRDAEVLDGLLDTDFTFHFDLNDVGKVVGGYIIPATWDREDFLAACGSMFDNAYSIDFEIAIESVTDPDDGATEFTAEDVQVRLLVMVDATNGYLAQGFCDFRFVNESADGTENWVITDWWDKTAFYGTYGSEDKEKSLGTILAMFI